MPGPVLEKLGLVETGYRSIEVLDPDGLREVASNGSPARETPGRRLPTRTT